MLISADVTNIGTISNSYTYDNDQLKIINHNGMDYNFSYDKWGSLSNVSVGTKSLLTYNYNISMPRLLQSLSYGNLQTQSYTYSNDLLSTVKFTNDATSRYTYTYDEFNALKSKNDYINDTCTLYKNGVVDEWNNSKTVLKHSYIYQDDGSLMETIAGTVLPIIKSKSDNDGRSLGISYDFGTSKTAKTEIRYDDLGRVTNTGIINGDTSLLWKNYLYKELPNGKSSNQIYAVDYSYGSQSSVFNNMLYYTYDLNGNITGITRNGVLKVSYEYDALGQLTRENNADSSKSTEYSYDAGD